jgi:hypothetical protein
VTSSLFATQTTLPARLEQIDARARTHEDETLRRSLKNKPITFARLRHLVQEELPRLGEGSEELLRTLEGLILAMVYTQGDLSSLEETHVDYGRAILEKHPLLWKDCVFPLLIYGSEYLRACHDLLPEEDCAHEDFSSEMSSFSYPQFIDTLLRKALQVRFRERMKGHSTQ